MPDQTQHSNAQALAGLGIAAAATLIFWLTDWDLELARAIYASAGFRWPGHGEAFWEAFYRWGEPPALVAGMLGGALALASYWRPSLGRWRGPGLFLFITLAVGPGLLVNYLAKGLGGRPRPEQLAGLGGLWEYRRPFELGLPGRGRSFLSGHASMGFYWMALFFLWSGAKRWWGLALGAAAGVLMGVARLRQGGHFASDILLCGALLFSIQAFFSPLIHRPPPGRFWRRPALLAALAVAAGATILISHPAYEERHFLPTPLDAPQIPATAMDRPVPLPWPAAADSASVVVELERGDLQVQLVDGALAPGSLALHERFWGMGTPGSRAAIEANSLSPDPRAPASLLRAGFFQRLGGRWWALKAAYHLRLPSTPALDLRLRSPRGRLSISGLPEGRRVYLRGLAKGQPPPTGFAPLNQDAYAREGALPLVALDLQAAEVVFE